LPALRSSPKSLSDAYHSDSSSPDSSPKSASPSGEELRDILDMGSVLAKPKKEKKVKILKPIAEESGLDVCHQMYKGVFKRCHQDLKEMRTGPKRYGAFFKALPKLAGLAQELSALNQSRQ
jgi:hypothetical protein